MAPFGKVDREKDSTEKEGEQREKGLRGWRRLLPCMRVYIGEWGKRTGITEINDGCVHMNIGTTRAQLCSEAGRRDICRCASTRGLPVGRSVCNVRSHSCKYSSLLKRGEKMQWTS